ncbi:hypothetical protein BJX76DRAFT_346983 [Aspergillus varians]
MSRKKAEPRSKKRTIVRWDSKLDELLLLTIHQVCNAQSIKIPWADVARTMGNNVSEGAIVQHLAKIRTRRVEADEEVPPPLKRGVGSGYTKASETRSGRGRKDDGKFNESEGSDKDWVENRASTRRRAGPERKRPRTRYNELSDIDAEGETDDSAGELVASGAKFLELPNDKQQEASRSPTPAIASKLVSYKCPKPFLAQLEEVSPKVNISEVTKRSISTPEPILKAELVTKREPAVKLESATPSYSYQKAFPDETFTNPATIPTGYSVTFDDTSGVHTGFAAHADFSTCTSFQSSAEGGTMYMPTGCPATDLSPMGGALSDPFSFDNSLLQLQAFEPDQNLAPDPGFQDMLGEYLIPLEDLGWHGEHLER